MINIILLFGCARKDCKLVKLMSSGGEYRTLTSWAVQDDNYIFYCFLHFDHLELTLLEIAPFYSCIFCSCFIYISLNDIT